MVFSFTFGRPSVQTLTNDCFLYPCHLQATRKKYRLPRGNAIAGGGATWDPSIMAGRAARSGRCPVYNVPHTASEKSDSPVLLNALTLKHTGSPAPSPRSLEAFSETLSVFTSVTHWVVAVAVDP